MHGHPPWRMEGTEVPWVEVHTVRVRPAFEPLTVRTLCTQSALAAGLERCRQQVKACITAMSDGKTD